MTSCSVELVSLAGQKIPKAILGAEALRIGFQCLDRIVVWVHAKGNDPKVLESAEAFLMLLDAEIHRRTDARAAGEEKAGEVDGVLQVIAGKLFAVLIRERPVWDMVVQAVPALLCLNDLRRPHAFQWLKEILFRRIDNEVVDQEGKNEHAHQDGPFLDILHAVKTTNST